MQKVNFAYVLRYIYLYSFWAVLFLKGLSTDYSVCDIKT